MKKCTKCLINKDYSHFHKCKEAKDGHKSRCKFCIAENKKNYLINSEKGTFKKYIYDANKRDLSFDLSLTEFNSFKDSSCFYCSSKLDRVRLDRIDNKVGYNMKNIVPCCSLCNTLKGTIEFDVFLNQIKNIYLNHKGKV